MTQRSFAKIFHDGVGQILCFVATHYETSQYMVQVMVNTDSNVQAQLVLVFGEGDEGAEAAFHAFDTFDERVAFSMARDMRANAPSSDALKEGPKIDSFTPNEVAESIDDEFTFEALDLDSLVNGRSKSNLH